MTFADVLATTVRQAVAEAVEPLRRELAQLRAERQAEVLTISEAAQRMKCSNRTIRRKLKAGEIEAVGEGRSRRVRLASAIDA